MTTDLSFAPIGGVAATGWTWLGEWLMSPGFGGLAAVVAALLALWGVQTNVRSQRAATRKQQWWERARWALNLTLSEQTSEREVGFAVLDALANSEWAQEHESDVIVAATEPTLTQYLETTLTEPVAITDEAQWEITSLRGESDDGEPDTIEDR